MKWGLIMDIEKDTEHARDKFALFILAGLVVAVLALVVIGIFWTRMVPDKGDVLLGSIVTGLIVFLRDLVNAVRQSWSEVKQTRMADQLSSALPGGGAEVPADAKEAAGQVADAAVEEAKHIKDR